MSCITEEKQAQFREEGYFILERVVSAEQLKILREACDHLIDVMHAEMDRLGTDHIHISHRHKRYHIAKQYDRAPRLGEFVFSELMAEFVAQPSVTRRFYFTINTSLKPLNKVWRFRGIRIAATSASRTRPTSLAGRRWTT